LSNVISGCAPHQAITDKTVTPSLFKDNFLTEFKKIIQKINLLANAVILRKASKMLVPTDFIKRLISAP